MRELIKKADHIGDKSYFKEHEDLFKGQYISFKFRIIMIIESFSFRLYSSKVFNSRR